MLQAATASDSSRLTTLQPYKYQDVSFAGKDSTGCFRFASLPEASEVRCSSGTSDFLDQASYGALDPYQGYQFPSGYNYNYDPFTTDCSGSAEAARHVRAGYDFTSGAVGPPIPNTAQNLDNRTQPGGVATDRGQATFPSPPEGSPPAGSMYVTMTTHASYSTCATSAATSNNSDGSPPSDPYSNVMVWLNHQACGGTVKRKRKINKIQRSAANIRERRRMIHLNVAFERLRERIPMFPYEKKPSRIRTLKMAIDYIAFMTELLHGKDNVLTKDRQSDTECSPAKSLPDW